MLRFRLLIIGRGMQRTAISNMISVTQLAMYIAPSFMIMVPTPVQLVEMGHAWKSVVRKNAMSHAKMIPMRMLAAVLNLCVANICL